MSHLPSVWKREEPLRELHRVGSGQRARIEVNRRQLENCRHHVSTGVVNLFEALFRAGNCQLGQLDHLCGMRSGKPLAQHVGQRRQAVAVCARLPSVHWAGNTCPLPDGGLHTGQVGGPRRTCGEQQLVAQRHVALDGIEQQFLKRALVERRDVFANQFLIGLPPLAPLPGRRLFGKEHLFTGILEPGKRNGDRVLAENPFFAHRAVAVASESAPRRQVRPAINGNEKSQDMGMATIVVLG